MSELMIGKTSDGLKLPVLVDTAGKLQIGGVQLDNLNVNTDQIEAKQDVTNALLTTTAADVAAVKTQLATGTIAVTGGGGGGGGASAAYNATLPTYTSGASSTLQTDVNGRLITTGTLTDTQLRASALPVSGAVTSNPPAGSLTMSNSSVGTSSATLLAAASATKVLAIQNTSANILYVSTTSPATATNSIVLSAGQGYEFSYVPSNALYALGSAASTTYTLWYA